MLSWMLCWPSPVEALRVHRLRQAEERLAAGSDWRNASDLIFTTVEGEPLHPNTVRWVLAQGIKAAGVPPSRSTAFAGLPRPLWVAAATWRPLRRSSATGRRRSRRMSTCRRPTPRCVAPPR